MRIQLAALVIVGSCAASCHGPQPHPPSQQPIRTDGSPRVTEACETMAVPVEEVRPAVNDGPDGVGYLVADGEIRHLWPSPGKIVVYFHDGTPEAQARVREVAVQWTQYANLDFEFLAPHERREAIDIGVSFAGEGYYSAIGTRSRDKTERGKPSMMLGGLDRLVSRDGEEFQRVVLHEFGHALGLYHEHLRPDRPFKWNKTAVYMYYQQKFDWTRTRVDSEIFANLADNPSWNSGQFDPYSVMVYQILPEFTTDGYATPYNTALSDADRRWIEALYPGRGRSGPLLTEETLALENSTRIAAPVLGKRSVRYRWTLKVKAPPALKHKIWGVKYLLHPTYGTRRARAVTDATADFAISDVAWGTFEVQATVFLVDGGTVQLRHTLNFCDAFDADERGRRARRRLAGRVDSKSGGSAVCDQSSQFTGDGAGDDLGPPESGDDP